MKRGINKLLRLIEEYGVINEMKFNANVKLTKLGKASERIQQDSTLSGEKITKVSELRYLGLELNDMNKNTLHLKKRRSLAYMHV